MKSSWFFVLAQLEYRRNEALRKIDATIDSLSCSVWGRMAGKALEGYDVYKR